MQNMFSRLRAFTRAHKAMGIKQNKQVMRGQKLTIALRTGGQGHPTPIHILTPTPTHTNIHKKSYESFFRHFET